MLGRRKAGDAFNEESRRALLDAAEEARRLGHPFIGPEHLLLALVRATREVPAAMLREMDVPPERVVAEVEGRQRRGTAPVPKGVLPFTSWMKKTMERAMTAARERGEDSVTPGHLLIGLAGAGGALADVMKTVGITARAADAAYDAAVGTGPAAGDASPTSRFEIRIDDTSASSIYEQLIAQIQEAVATRALQPGERLPTVRQLADHLDIAPGTVARAYGELERLGVVVTGGARGTRVADRERGISAADRPETLVGLLRPVAVAAFHLGASADELRAALEHAMQGIFGRSNAA